MSEDPLKSHLPAYLERANSLAMGVNLAELLPGTLALLAEAAGAQAGLLFLLDNETNELVCQATWGVAQSQALEELRLPAGAGLAGEAMQQRAPQLLHDVTADAAWQIGLRLLSQAVQGYVLYLPLCGRRSSLGVIQLYGCPSPALELLSLLADRMATELENALRLEIVRQHSDRLSAMIAIFEQIGSTLDRDKLLRMMIEYAREVTNAEACSLFLVDEETHENVLHLASNLGSGFGVDPVRVPGGKGIIGHVVDTGNPVLVPDVSQDERFYQDVDKSSGFVTRAILAVPLRTRTVLLGQQRGSITTHVIGGFETLNKRKGTFDETDARFLGTLANQAATVLQIAELYGDANQLFLDVIKSLAAAIDAKDPYTEGHSQRVSDFSVEIASQMGLNAEMQHRIRIGSLLHDVGKIGIPDSILTKPDRLTEAEFAIMKEHPVIGANIMGQVQKLRAELPALSEHHERLDGTGYPHGLAGDQISLFGRIVSVADVFDAMTSDRPYRAGMPVEDVLDYLHQGKNTKFDPRCVDALDKGYLAGVIRTQPEVERLKRKSLR